MVLLGYAGCCVLDALMQLIRVTEVLKSYQYIIVIIMLLNFVVTLGFFIAIHVVRFRGSGMDCSELYLQHRGRMFKIYVIAAWSFLCASCIITLGYGFYLRRRKLRDDL